MGQLGRDALLQKEELEIVKVDLGKGDFVYVRQMTGHERDSFEQSLIKKNKDAKGLVISYDQATDDYRAKLAVRTVCNEKGELILKPGDVLVLSNNMTARKLEKIINKAQEINAITEEDKENIIKNLESAQDGGSSSDSAEN